MTRSRSAVLVVSHLALLVAAASARADVDVAVRNGFKARGTLNPAAEFETYRIEIPAGATLKVSVKGRKAKGAPAAPRAGFEIVAPTAGDLTDATPTTPKGATGAAWSGLVPETGVYRIVVSGDGVVGDYDVTASWSVPKKTPFGGDTSGGEVEVPFEFAAGTQVSFVVKRAQGSASLPRLDRICSDGGCGAIFAPPREGATSHSGRGTISSTGTWRIFVADAGAGGPFTGTATATLPRETSKRVDLTDRKLGPGDGSLATGAVVGAEGGMVAVDDALSPVDGASVDVPGGALALPTGIIVGTGAAVAPKAEDVAGGGPAVFFGPEGTSFAVPATVTIPYAPLPPGTTTDDLRIFVRDAKGKVTEVVLAPPAAFVFDTVNRTVSFPVAHFSTYQAFRPRGVVDWDLDADGLADLVVGSPGENGDRGSVSVFRGGTIAATTSASSASPKFTNGTPGDELGRFVASGDLDGDGVADLAVSARQPATVGILFGKSGFGASGDADIEITGSAADPNFGNQLHIADVTGDGVDDLIVGDESNNRTGTGNGAVLIFFGPLTASTTADAADVILTGEAASDLFGAAIASGDLIGSGARDLVVGADQIDTAGATGRCYVFAGPIVAGTRPASTADVILTGEGTDSGFGIPLAVGDVTGGGRADLLVGAVEFNQGGSAAGAGRIYGFRGEDGLASAGASTADFMFFGVAAGDHLGAAIGAADVTGDGLADVLATAPGADNGADADAGVVVVFDSPASQSWATGRRFFGAAGEQFGIFGFPPIDVNGDGIRDVIAGSPLAESGNGAVRILFGGTIPAMTVPSGANVRISGEPGQKFGGKD
ncbi:MAG: hypothetical protein HMLKMBBP_00187 [Planctomycetes bacterium]|nr:hypothetical protein [Planctomycetota bacterium]